MQILQHLGLASQRSTLCLKRVRFAGPLIIWLAAIACFCSPAFGDIVVQKRYLHIPVAREGQPRMVYLSVDGQIVHYFLISLPARKQDAFYWASIDVAGLKGKTMIAAAQPPGPEIDVAGLSEQSDAVRQPQDLYKEPYRPQYHFSPPTGWMNDPNGLNFLDGEYHMFYQHNPFGTASANKSWGHATSRDLVRWTDFGDALLPDRLGAMYSGSAVTDVNNTSGFGTGSAPPMVAVYTTAGVHAPEKPPFTQSVAFSTDRGRTWSKYEKNPVIGHIEGTNRDPKVFWHKGSGQWVMVLYLVRGKFTLLGSSNLKDWRRLNDIDFPDGHECPDLFELPVDGDARNTRWVIWEGAGRHMIGSFDGGRFLPESGVLPSEWGKHCYAGQTWNGVTDGRRLFVCWMRANGPNQVTEPAYPEMPFNQQMSFPREFSLRSTPEGIRLFAQPAREISALYSKQHRFADVALKPGVNPLGGISGELFDIEAKLDVPKAATATLEIRGTRISYDAQEGRLSCMGKSVALKPAGVLDLRVQVDRTSIEVFADGGRYVMSFCFKPDPANRQLILSAEGGTPVAKSVQVRILKPALPMSAAK